MEPSATPLPETISFGHYRVARRVDGSLDELGRGGMGVTYRAEDPGLRIPVALKVIAAGQVHEADVRRRFQREARAAAQLRHPNVASVLHLGEQGGEFFYAMEFVAGRPLSALLKEQKTLPVPVALALAAQVAAALAAAHKHGLIHRDLKPQNLMLLEGDALDHEDERTAAAGGRQVKVIDFGLARSFGDKKLEDSFSSQSALTGGFLGTPAYASPEQCAESPDLDGRSDLYSLGIVLWQCLTGRLPFTGTLAYVVGQQQFQAPPLEQLEELSPAIAELLAGLLEKSPAARRPATAAELRDALDSLRRGSPVPLAGASVPPAVAPPASPLPPVPADSTPTRGSLGGLDTLRDPPPAALIQPPGGTLTRLGSRLWFKAASLALGAFVVLFAVLAVIEFFSPGKLANSNGLGESDYQVSPQETIRYSGDATQDEARRVGEALSEARYFDSSQPRRVLLRRQDGRPLTVSFIVSGEWETPAALARFQQLGAKISGKLGPQPLLLRAVDDKGKVLKEFPPAEKVAPSPTPTPTPDTKSPWLKLDPKPTPANEKLDLDKIR